MSIINMAKLTTSKVNMAKETMNQYFIVKLKIN
jgi:hypothetical protein